MTSVIVRKNEIDVVSRETYTAGSVNVYTVNAKLSNEWKALSATPVFRSGSVRISTVFDEYGGCIIPHEVLAQAGKMLEFGVYGVNDSGAELPTLWANLDYIREGTSPGDNAQEPTPSLYDQLVGQVGAAVNDARGYADSAAASAETAGNAERGAGLSAGHAAESAEDAKTAALAAAKSETAADAAAKDAQTASEAAVKAAQGAAADKAASETAANNAAQAESAAAASANAAAEAKTGAETARDAAETAKTGAETARDAAETAKTGAETARDAAQGYASDAQEALSGAQGVVEDVKQGLNQLKQDLDNKLPKSPANWETWTADEQKAAQEKMGFNNAAYLVETIELTESVSSVVRSYDTAGVAYNFKAMRIRIFNTSGDNTTASVSANGISLTYSTIQKNSYAPILLDCTSGLLNVVSTQSTNPDEGARNPVMPRIRAIGYIMTSINKIEIVGVLPAGTKIEIYGVRA